MSHFTALLVAKFFARILARIGEFVRIRAANAIEKKDEIARIRDFMREILKYSRRFLFEQFRARKCKKKPEFYFLLFSFLERIRARISMFLF